MSDERDFTPPTAVGSGATVSILGNYDNGF
ncbi:hypothetical protein M2251_000297 [Rhodococcus erythropolis]|nr:hypothetical protein [Rhodococcus erythropolis]